MPGPTTETLADDLKEVRSDLHKLAVEVAKLSAEFGLAKWLLGLTLAATLTAIGGGIWWAATLTAEVRHLAGAVTATRPAPAANAPRAN